MRSERRESSEGRGTQRKICREDRWEIIDVNMTAPLWRWAERPLSLQYRSETSAWGKNLLITTRHQSVRFYIEWDKRKPAVKLQISVQKGRTALRWTMEDPTISTSMIQQNMKYTPLL
ncbi:hypothetical protein Bbelb_203860 [Branchiostoma belcheri]|nr:hypothetical protein Bbelb_203860 [Branchiostoma belcheri]